jgi:Phospholipase_D-nuclease N-terminal
MRDRLPGVRVALAPYCWSVVRFLPFLISLVLTVYALFSCVQTREEDVPYLPKLVWIVLIVFLPFVGPIAWLLVSRGAGGFERPSRPRPQGKPVAPDDDPDFLATLDRYRDPRMTSHPPKDEPKPPQDTKPEEPEPEDKRRPKKERPSESESEAPTEPDDGKP